jgi:putative transposase
MRCRHVYNAAVGERRSAWQCGVSVTSSHHIAELPAINSALPECGEVNAQVVQDVVRRVDRAYQAFLRRVQAGETAGYPLSRARPLPRVHLSAGGRA